MRRFLSVVKGRYPYRDDIECHPSEWTVPSKGIDYLRELVMKEVLYGDWDINISREQVLATKSLLKRFVQSAPLAYAHTLATMLWDRPLSARA